MNLNDYTMRCGIGSECRHNLCEGTCGRPLRKSGHSAGQHPWTVALFAYNMCRPCARAVSKLTPADLQDQRHIIMTDKQLAHVYKADKHMHAWHMNRRHRLGLTTAA